jgi:hypothetical protein
MSNFVNVRELERRDGRRCALEESVDKASYLINEHAACKVIRHHMARLIGFAWSKTASVGVDISVFESTGIYFSTPTY